MVRVLRVILDAAISFFSFFRVCRRPQPEPVAVEVNQEQDRRQHEQSQDDRSAHAAAAAEDSDPSLIPVATTSSPWQHEDFLRDPYLPWLHTLPDEELIKATYNKGLIHGVDVKRLRELRGSTSCTHDLLELLMTSPEDTFTPFLDVVEELGGRAKREQFRLLMPSSPVQQGEQAAPACPWQNPRFVTDTYKHWILNMDPIKLREMAIRQDMITTAQIFELQRLVACECHPELTDFPMYLEEPMTGPEHRTHNRRLLQMMADGGLVSFWKFMNGLSSITCFYGIRHSFSRLLPPGVACPLPSGAELAAEPRCENPWTSLNIRAKPFRGYFLESVNRGRLRRKALQMNLIDEREEKVLAECQGRIAQNAVLLDMIRHRGIESYVCFMNVIAELDRQRLWFLLASLLPSGFDLSRCVPVYLADAYTSEPIAPGMYKPKYEDCPRVTNPIEVAADALKPDDETRRLTSTITPPGYGTMRKN
ncbi:uncharacterized protein LOC135821159 isoform X1 [Sycon ciliatum]|uniref:uncharacterized protein LOC135821159 isoform X1 n=1 Tax=Sycon ciliatum TaxID=27933 RepID=UPI0031F64AE4